MFKPELIKQVEQQAPSSMQDIEEVMDNMDRHFKSNFKEWIRDESNLSYICTIKRHVFMKEFRADQKLGIQAIRWITESWSVSSVMEFIMKMFATMTIDSTEFANIVSDITNDWPMDKKNDLIKLLLVGESVTTCARFLYNSFNGISRSDQTQLLAFLANSLGWESSFLRLFLLDFSMMINANGVEHKALIVLIHQSMDEVDLQYKNVDLKDLKEFQDKSVKSGIVAPPSSPKGTPPLCNGWESSLKKEEDSLIRKLVSIQEFKVFLALFEVIMDIHDKAESDLEEEITEKLLYELEL